MIVGYVWQILGRRAFSGGDGGVVNSPEKAHPK